LDGAASGASGSGVLAWMVLPQALPARIVLPFSECVRTLSS